MMTNYCRVPLQSWVCLRSMRKKDKINVCISSTIVIVSLVSYGTHYGAHDWTNSDPKRLNYWPSAMRQDMKGRHETQTSFLCYTSNADVIRTWRRNSNIFPAKISEKDLIFLSIDKNIKQFLGVNQINFTNSCFTIHEKFLYHCCGYSPFLKERVSHVTTNETNFSFERYVIPDSYFRIEDIVNGKAEEVNMTIKVNLMTEEQTQIEIIAQHRCRGDVIVDPYPEIHFNIYRQKSDGNRAYSEYHWYL